MTTQRNDGHRDVPRSFVRRHFSFSLRELAIVLVLGAAAGILAGKLATPAPDPWAPANEPVAAHCASTLAIAGAALDGGTSPDAPKAGDRPDLSELYPECY